MGVITRKVTSELRLSGMAINRCYIKLMVVGDHNVGKTSLLIAFAHNTFSVEPPTMFDSYTTQIGVDDNGTKRTITLAPWDSGGQVTRSIIYWVILAITMYLKSITINLKSN